MVREYIASVYSILEGGFRMSSEKNYEFSLFMLEPGVPIDFNRSMFDQPDLRPIVPAATAFQLGVENDDDAIDFTRRVIEIISHFELDIDIKRFNDWIGLMPGACLIKPTKKYLQAA